MDKVWLIGITMFLFSSCGPSTYEKIAPLDSPKKSPAEGDWLAEHTESYQSFSAYKSSHPIQSSSQRPFLYVVKMGKYSTWDDSLFSIVSKGLSACFQIEVKVLTPMPDSVMKSSLIRENGQWDANFIIQHLLPRVIPYNAVALIALSSKDLYPGNDWNYVFGLASLKNRTGVWSVYRMGNPACGWDEFKLAAKRTLHVALHETGHMFGIWHCVSYECIMNGSNSLSELDSQTNWFCHDCLQKLCWNRNMPPQKHLKAMQEFYAQHFPNSACLNYYVEAVELLND